MTKLVSSPYGIWCLEINQESVAKTNSYAKVGNGESISFWEDKWIGKFLWSSYIQMYTIWIRNKTQLLEMFGTIKVGMWDTGMFNDWEIDRLSDFYFTLEQFKGVSNSVDMFYGFWKAKVITLSSCRRKIQYFKRSYWLLTSRNAVLTQDGLMKRGLQLCSTCCLCGEEVDTINQVFLHWKITSQMWRILKNLKRTCVLMPGSTLETLAKLE